MSYTQLRYAKSGYRTTDLKQNSLIIDIITVALNKYFRRTIQFHAEYLKGRNLDSNVYVQLFADFPISIKGRDFLVKWISLSCNTILNKIHFVKLFNIAQSAWGVEYANCPSAEE